MRSHALDVNAERGEGGQDAPESGSMDSFGLLDLGNLFPRHDQGLQLGWEGVPVGVGGLSKWGQEGDPMRGGCAEEEKQKRISLVSDPEGDELLAP